MKKQSVDDIIMNGIKGTPELKKEEKNKYLGTYRERVEIVLTIGQVMKPTTYSDITHSLQTLKNIELLLNGDVSYQYLSKYIKVANTYHVPFSIVQNNESDTEIGLVITHKTAIDKTDIFIKE